MITINNLFNNDNINVLDTKGNISIIEYKKDKSVQYSEAVNEFYAAQMNVRRRQAVISLNNDSFIISGGAMQWMAGNIQVATDVKGVGDLFGKMLKGAVTNESAIKPKYTGTGTLMLEPTYKHLIIEDVSNWQHGLVVEDGLFLGCNDSVQQKVIARSNLSSAALGNEGLFNLMLQGKGYVILESRCPREELIEVVLEQDTLKVDGSFAIAWSGSLEFTVERTTKTLIGSAASGEGLVNVYRGTGKVLLAPIQ